MSQSIAFEPLPREEQADGPLEADATYRALLDRLSRQSVTKHYDAYADIPWDDPEYAVDPADPRFELGASSPLGATGWYRALPQPERARLGLELLASFAMIGSQFENALQRGLLEFVQRLPTGAPEFRYAMHEVIEEGHHSLMFREFVHRTGLPIPGLPWYLRLGSRMVVRLGRRFPELFFLFVIGGEDPIDHVQREDLAAGESSHPLVRLISKVHITEEARHLSFARAYLRRHVPRLGVVKRTLLRLRTPLLLGEMANLMMRPTPETIRRYSIPKAVLREAYATPEARALRAAALRKPRALCVELGIAVPPYDRLWRRMGIW